MGIQELILVAGPETADERAQLDACLTEAGGDGRLALLILLRRIDSITAHHETLARIRARIVAVAH